MLDNIFRWSRSMTKRLCKLNRREIAQGLGHIFSLVSDAKYLCRSCARSSQDSSKLCRPTAIPPSSCLSKSSAEQQQCAVLVDSLASDSSETPVELQNKVTKKELKKAKKQTKKQKKLVKKMEKIARRQNNLIKKQKKIEQQFLKFNSVCNQTDTPSALH